jgi:hypothetical protein
MINRVTIRRVTIRRVTICLVTALTLACAAPASAADRDDGHLDSRTVETTHLWAEKVSSHPLAWQGTLAIEQVRQGRRVVSTIRLQMWRSVCDVAGCLDVLSEGHTRLPCAVLRESGPKTSRTAEFTITIPITTTTRRISGTESLVIDSRTTSLPVRVTATLAESSRQERHLVSSLIGRDPAQVISVRQGPARVDVALGSMRWGATAGGIVRTVERAG